MRMYERKAMDELDHHLVELHLSSSSSDSPSKTSSKSRPPQEFGASEDTTLQDEDEILGDALERAFRLDRIKDLLETKKEELQGLHEKMDALEGRAKGSIVHGLAKTKDLVQNLGRIHSEAHKMYEEVEEESKRVQPLVEQVGPLLTELTVLKNVRAYVGCQKMLASKRGLTADRLTLLDIEELCIAYENYREFLKKAKIGDTMELGAQFQSQIENMTLKMREKIEGELKLALKSIGWPKTATNPVLRTDANLITKLQNAFGELINLQMLYLKYNQTKYLDHALEFTTELWGIRAMAKPITQRFRYHFSGKRELNQIDKPEWCHSFILDALKDHSGFLVDFVQPITESIIGGDRAGAYVDVLAHFMRILIKTLHKHYSLNWPLLKEADALICHTIDEALQLQKTMVDQFGYCSVSGSAVPNEINENPPWPKLVSFFVWDQIKFEKWTHADLEFARRNLTLLLNRPNAWKTLCEVIGQDQQRNNEEPNVVRTERMVIPECCEQYIALVSSISDRGRSLPALSSRLFFLQAVQLPLMDSFCDHLEDRIKRLNIGPKTIAQVIPPMFQSYMTIINAAEFSKGVFRKWEEEPQYILLSHYESELVSSNATYLAKSDEKTTTAEGKDQTPTRSKVSLFSSKVLETGKGLLKRNLQHLKRIRERTARSLDPTQTQMSVFSAAIDRYETFVEQYALNLAFTIFKTFEGDCKQYIHLCTQENHYQRAQGEPMSPGTEREVSPALGFALTELRSRYLEKIQANGHPAVIDKIVSYLAKEMKKHFIINVADNCKFDASGGKRFARDMEAVYAVFKPFARKPENRFFRSLKERSKLLSTPSHELSSLFKALQSLTSSWDGTKDSPEGREITSILEDGYGISCLTVQDAWNIKNSRVDCK